MVRDMDLIREIVLKAEPAGYGELHTRDFVSDRHDELSIAEHFYLLEQAGLAEVNIIKSEQYGAGPGTLDRLTNEGHDFSKAIKNDTAWGKIKDEVRRNGGAWTVAILNALSDRLLNRQFGLSE